MDDGDPRYLRFTSTPRSPIEDYFEKGHKTREPKHVESMEDSIYHDMSSNVSEELKSLQDKDDSTFSNEKLETNLDSIIKKTPVKVIDTSSKRNNKENITKTDYDSVMSEAMRNLELSGKLRKHKKFMVSLPLSTISNVAFKTPNISKDKMSKSVDSCTTFNEPILSVPVPAMKFENIVESSNTARADNALTKTEKTEKDCQNRNENDSPPSDLLHDPCVTLSNKNNEIEQKRRKETQSTSHIPVSRYSRTSMCQFRRHSINPKRSKQYTSLAEAVHKFQNSTPERFHSVNKNTKKFVTKDKKPSSKVTDAEIGIKKTRSHSHEEQGTAKIEKTKDLKLKSNPAELCTLKSTSSLVRSTTEIAGGSLRTLQKRKRCQSATIIDMNDGKIVVKKEEVLFFGIPANTNTNIKKITHPVPFSFDKRVQASIKKKKERSKQTSEEDKKPRTFCAHPVPIFKPVMVHGLSRQNLARTKGSTSGAITACLNSEKKEVALKTLPPKLKTDVRVKERRKFEENIKQKKETEKFQKEKEEKKGKEKEEQRRKEEVDKGNIEDAKLRKKKQINIKPTLPYKLLDKSKKPLTEPQSPAWSNKNKKSRKVI